MLRQRRAACSRGQPWRAGRDAAAGTGRDPVSTAAFGLHPNPTGQVTAEADMLPAKSGLCNKSRKVRTPPRGTVMAWTPDGLHPTPPTSVHAPHSPVRGHGSGRHQALRRDKCGAVRAGRARGWESPERLPGRPDEGRTALRHSGRRGAHGSVLRQRNGRSGPARAREATVPRIRRKDQGAMPEGIAMGDSRQPD